MIIIISEKLMWFNLNYEIIFQIKELYKQNKLNERLKMFYDNVNLILFFQDLLWEKNNQKINRIIK